MLGVTTSRQRRRSESLVPFTYNASMVTSDPSPPLLEIEDLHLHYLGGPGRTVHAVDGISFALRERGTALGAGGWVRETAMLSALPPSSGRPSTRLKVRP